MNLVEYGVGSILAAITISVFIGLIGVPINQPTLTDVDSQDIQAKLAQFNKTSGELQEIGKIPDPDALDETSSYMNIQNSMNSAGDFLKMALSQYIHMGSTLKNVGLPGVIAFALWWFWQISAWASIGGFIITRLNK